LDEAREGQDKSGGVRETRPRGIYDSEPRGIYDCEPAHVGMGSMGAGETVVSALRVLQSGAPFFYRTFYSRV